MTTAHDIEIREARPQEAEEIAALIRRAFEIQCRIYDDWSLPPMRESAESVLRSMRDGTLLVALAEEPPRIVGTVQGRALEDGGVYVGRLAVDPELHRRGIGRALASALEAHYPDAQRFELFTGHLSEHALGLYESMGYRRVKETEEHDGLVLVYLEKDRKTG